MSTTAHLHRAVRIEAAPNGTEKSFRSRIDTLRQRERRTAAMVAAIESKMARLSTARDERMTALKSIHREIVLAEQPRSLAPERYDPRLH